MTKPLQPVIKRKRRRHMGCRRLMLVPQLVVLLYLQVLLAFHTTTYNWCCDCFQLGGGRGGGIKMSTTTTPLRSSLLSSSSSLSLSSSTEESDAVTTTDIETKEEVEQQQQQLKVVPYVIDETVLSKLLLSENNNNNDSKTNTQTKLSLNQVREYNELIESLPTPEDELDINGGWNLLATISPNALEGDNVDFFDLNSWKNYIDGSGPSPFQSLITGSSRVDGLITQWLTPNDFDNVVEFNLFSNILKGKLVIKASLESIENNNQKRVFKFRNGFFILNTIWNAKIVVPYPVPFKLLGDRAIGFLETIGYDPISGIRAAVGNKGTKFIFQKKIQTPQKNTAVLTKGEEGKKESSSSSSSSSLLPSAALPPKDIDTAYQVYSERIVHDTDEEERIKNEGLVLRPVVICPQQFGGKPGDYTELINKLRKIGHPVYLVRLSTLEWLSITKSAFSKAYLVGELEPKKALPFYLDAIDKTVAKVPTNDNNNGEYSILSHSIGGWIARAWLGEIATPEQRKRCIRYVSLGTPHLSPPPESLVAKVDQTRGLLKYINDRWPGSYWNGHDDGSIEYTCVASKCVSGKLELNLDSLLAYASYFALSGDGTIQGDGITPVDAAILDGSRKIVLDDVYHADVLPNPIGGRNTKLVECVWYADRIDEWVDAL